jgi:carboxypeptidase Taq
MMESGNFAPILGWLKDKIYSKGQSIPPQELVKQVTGKPIGAEDYLAGINKRYREIYDI